jgi:hypothetical protein
MRFSNSAENKGSEAKSFSSMSIGPTLCAQSRSIDGLGFSEYRKPLIVAIANVPLETTKGWTQQRHPAWHV